MRKQEFYMQKCLDLAYKGKENVSPNPLVGSVIVCNEKIIGEGYHEKYGCSHAEVNAINSVKKKYLLNESTLYVNLEPCAHFGKTPPCSDLIIKHKIPKVIIGCIDTFSNVAGRGVKKMKDAGIKVVVGVLEEQCREINKRFFTFHEKKRPYIIVFAFILGMILTPPDVISQILLALPIWLLFEFGLLLAKLFTKNKAKSNRG